MPSLIKLSITNVSHPYRARAYARFAKLDSLDDKLRATVRKHHPPAPPEIILDFGNGMKIPAIEPDLCRYAEDARQEFGDNSEEYKTALHLVSLRQKWDKACLAVDEQRGTLKYKAERDEAERIYHDAVSAFERRKASTPLGLFLRLLETDAGDDFADEHPVVVETIIQHLLSAGSPIDITLDPVVALAEQFDLAYADSTRVSSREPKPGSDARRCADWEKDDRRIAGILGNAYSALLVTPASTAHGVSLKLRSMLKWEMGDGQRVTVSQAADTLDRLAIAAPQGGA